MQFFSKFMNKCSNIVIFLNTKNASTMRALYKMKLVLTIANLSWFKFKIAGRTLGAN